MVRFRFPTLAAVAMTLPLLSSCSSDSKPAASTQASSSAAPRTTAARTSACKPVPAKAEQPDWFPADLPLPAGSFAVADTQSPTTLTDSDATTTVPDSDAASGTVSETHRGFFAVKGTIDDFLRFARTDWAAKGWSLGRGDQEAGEADDGFRKGDFGGSFRIRDVYCDATMTELLITYGKGTAPG